SAAMPAIRLEPLGNMPVVKDLVTDMDTFWRKLRERRPWLFPPAAAPGPDDEYRVSPQEYDVLAEGLLCVECGCCYSDCNSLDSEPRFHGPTAFVKAFRYAVDPRDAAFAQRAADLSDEHGVWECMRCYFCTQRCPKHIRVRELIAQLGALAVRDGLESDPGARHAQAFVDSLRASGRLNETDLALKSQGWAWAAQRLPMAVRIALAGKLALPPRPVPGHERLLEVMLAAERQERSLSGDRTAPMPPPQHRETTEMDD
ncbi:MAG TPA: 4Fe-4S dicluster domain-containing protein, partial [Candidatus Dormibacteraeota bacterium]|nr:4Fe-4S dicluster domain-containing protein [Candidatus Dormibacteraeota bacterium]